MIRILIVEDMILLQESLANIINGQEDMEVVGVIANADEALASCRELSPDLALIDVVTENKANGIAAAAEIRRKLPNIKIVIMTALPEITFIDAARKAGAHSFLYKDSTSQHVLYVIRCTMKDKGTYPGPGNEALGQVNFSDTEIAVIRLVCQGKKLDEIIQNLSIPECSVKEVISSILYKTGFDSITKFSIYAVANGFIVPDNSIPVEHGASSGKAGSQRPADSAVVDVDMSSFYKFKQNLKKLTKTEAAVLELYIAGYSSEQITEKLFVSINTIKSHNKNIYKKLDVSSMKELKVYAQMMKIST